MYLLQVRYKETDRGIEGRIKDTPVLQAFAGQGMCKKWKCPDHTKIEEFRNRLKPETHREIANYMAQLGYKLGYGDASWMDVDSTVQEANMAYPSDSQLMRKLVFKREKDCRGIEGKNEQGEQEVFRENRSDHEEGAGVLFFVRHEAYVYRSSSLPRKAESSPASGKRVLGL